MRIFISFLSLAVLLNADQFSDYWYAGKAEVAVYDLEQWGYGELRKGTATLIFVTEPFSKGKHVKLDHPIKAGGDKATVLKMNRIKKYTTGLYPYSFMTSAFVKVSDGTLLKANTSLQEWCGHSFLQANLNAQNSYDYSQYSYFESQGDVAKTVTGILAEELFLSVRLAKFPSLGKIKEIVPPQEYSRLLLFPYESTSARTEIEESEETITYKIFYDNTLKLHSEIITDKEFPYTIKGWEESYERGGKRYTNKAVLKTVQQLPYWQMNAQSYLPMRKNLGLE